MDFSQTVGTTNFHQKQKEDMLRGKIKREKIMLLKVVTAFWIKRQKRVGTLPSDQFSLYNPV